MPHECVTIGPCTLYRGDCREVLLNVTAVDCVVADPPYGIAYESGKTGHHGGTSLPGIKGDDDTAVRDWIVDWANGLPMLVFGSWKRPRPKNVVAVLTWEKGDHVGMGDLSLPWKPNTEEIYVIGKGFSGHRGSSVLRHNAPVSWNSVAFGRLHPHEKPLSLMLELVAKCPRGTVCDPCVGSGVTAVACINEGREFIGCEIDDETFGAACRRIERAWQDKRSELPFEKPAPLVQRNLIA